MVSQRISDTTS